ncbi:NAD(P)-dependent oxidoreductase [Siculibacillus lacustris]|nr:DUF1932 domain-containing protein [Siculibacillus lacustris]
MGATAIRLGFVGFGEAAGLFAAGLAAAGIGPLVAVDPAAADSTARQRLLERAGAATVDLAADASRLAAATVVFCLVPAPVDRAATRSAAPHIAPGALWVDFSSTSPEDKRACAAIVAAAGGRYLDAAILGSVPTSGHRVPVIVCGEGAADFAAAFNRFGMAIAPVEGPIGTAAGVKLVRSILAKGLEALWVEALLVARGAGVLDAVLDDFCGFLDARPARATAELLVESHPIHAARRADEVRLSRDIVLAVGIAPTLTDAIVARLEATAATGVADKLAGRPPADLATALAVLAEAGAPRSDDLAIPPPDGPRSSR